MGETIPLARKRVPSHIRAEPQAPLSACGSSSGCVLIADPRGSAGSRACSRFTSRGTTWSRSDIHFQWHLICGGGIGNLIDRIARGYVVDMFDCRFIPGIDFPVFNVADIFICVGCGLLLLDVIFLEGKRAEQ